MPRFGKEWAREAGMTAQGYPDRTRRYPLEGYDRLVFLENVVANPAISVGRYTYFDATGTPAERAEDFERNNVLYHFDFIGDKLVIGSFCAIGSGVRFIMNGANHPLAGVSTYPFAIFQQGWEQAGLPTGHRGDTVVESDVWLGYGAVILPGRHIGAGAVVGAGSVVTRDVPPYAIVGGNPARLIRQRYPEAVVKRLLALAWWDWPIDKISRNVALLAAGDIAALEQA
jgi:virginiamycin A acetyltransferase